MQNTVASLLKKGKIQMWILVFRSNKIYLFLEKLFNDMIDWLIQFYIIFNIIHFSWMPLSHFSEQDIPILHLIIITIKSWIFMRITVFWLAESEHLQAPLIGYRWCILLTHIVRCNIKINSGLSYPHPLSIIMELA